MKPYLILILMLGLLPAVVGSSPAEAASGQRSRPFVQRGEASFYGPGLHGRRTGSAAQHLELDAETLMQRNYVSPEDGRQEFEEFNRTGKLQPSFAQLLRHDLVAPHGFAE